MPSSRKYPAGWISCAFFKNPNTNCFEALFKTGFKYKKLALEQAYKDELENINSNSKSEE